MNPYDPHDADESQLDRIERKLDRLDGLYLATLVLAALFTASIFVLVEIVSARWKF
jgi:hypothetical protein